MIDNQRILSLKLEVPSGQRLSTQHQHPSYWVQAIQNISCPRLPAQCGRHQAAGTTDVSEWSFEPRSFLTEPYSLPSSAPTSALTIFPRARWALLNCAISTSSVRILAYLPCYRSFRHPKHRHMRNAGRVHTLTTTTTRPFPTLFYRVRAHPASKSPSVAIFLLNDSSEDATIKVVPQQPAIPSLQPLHRVKVMGVPEGSEH